MFDVFDILKSRVGVYEDTPHNRRLNRVGQHYGQEAQPDEASEKDRERAERLLKYTKALEEVQNKLKDPYLSSKAYESGKDLEAKLTDKIQKLRERMGRKAFSIAQTMIEANVQEKGKPKTPYEEMETSLRFKYSSERVKFKTRTLDISEFSSKDLKVFDDWYFTGQQRDSKSGKYVFGNGDYYDHKETTLGEMIDWVVKEAKDMYIYNDSGADHMYEIMSRTDEDSPYHISISTSLETDNKVRISILRYKERKREPLPDEILTQKRVEPNLEYIHDEEEKAAVKAIFNGDNVDNNYWESLDEGHRLLLLQEAGFSGLIGDDFEMGQLYYPQEKERLLSVLEEAIINENDERYGMDETQSWAVGYTDGSIRYLNHGLDNDFEMKLSDNQLLGTQYKNARRIIRENKIQWILFSDGYDPPRYWAKNSEALASLKKYGGFEAWVDGVGEKKRDYLKDDWV